MIIRRDVIFKFSINQLKGIAGMQGNDRNNKVLTIKTMISQQARFFIVSLGVWISASVTRVVVRKQKKTAMVKHYAKTTVILGSSFTLKPYREITADPWPRPDFNCNAHRIISLEKN